MTNCTAHHDDRLRKAAAALTAVSTVIAICFTWFGPAPLYADEADQVDDHNAVPRIAAIVTAYYRNSHADVIVSRLMQGYHLDDHPPYPKLQLASLYIDQAHPEEIGRALAERHGVPVYDSVADALTLGGDTLAVDGVLLIAEHGEYPGSQTGQKMYPKRRLFGEVADVFERSGRAVPVFCDKHLADNWEDAKWVYDEAERLGVPLMAGSSLPVLWRLPAADVRRGARLEQVVAVSYHTLDSYGFHALEMVQSLIERRAGGETGVRSVQCIEGEAVWQAGRDGVYDPALLEAALGRLRERPLKPGQSVEQLAVQPALLVIDYRDGLRVCVLNLDKVVIEWAVAWRYADDDPQMPGQVRSTLFWTQPQRPFSHFMHLLRGVERMMHTGEPSWPAERTLLTSGTLDALHISKLRGRRVDTPYLDIRYRTDWDWQQPPPPPGRQPSGPDPWAPEPQSAQETQPAQ